MKNLRCIRSGKFLVTWLSILVVFVICGLPAIASDVELIINNGAPEDPAPIDLEMAIDSANDAAYSLPGSIYDTSVKITLNEDEELLTGTTIPSADSHYFLHGGNPLDPTDVGSHGGFGEVIINGNGSTIGLSGGYGRVLEIMNVQGSVTISELTITGGNVWLTASSVDAYGGGAFLHEFEKGTFKGVTFQGNKATSEQGASFGGGLAQTGSGPDARLEISESHFLNNLARGITAQGGGIYSEAPLEIIKKEDDEGASVISENEARGETFAQGGGIYAGSTLEAGAATISNNIASADEDGKAYGGGIYVVGEANIADGTKITGNQIRGTLVDENDETQGYQGLSIAMGGGIYAEDILNVDTSTISNNIADAIADGGIASGGGIYAKGVTNIIGTSGENVTNVYAYITGNEANGHAGAMGGGIYAEDTLTLDYVSVGYNLTTAIDEVAGYAYGGGIYSKEVLDISNATYIRNNQASGWVEKADEDDEDDEDVIHDIVDAKGGGIYAEESVTIDGSYVIYNSAIATADDGKAHGGGIYSQEKLEISGESNIAYNKAEGDSEAFGGGIFADEELILDGKVTVEGNTATANNGAAQGGGIYAWDKVNIDGETTVSQNSATGTDEAQGGGIYSANDDIVVLGSFALEKNIAEATDGDAQGGGIYAEGAIDIKGDDDPDSHAKTTVTISGNKVTATDVAQGGALYAGSTLSITNVTSMTITGNSATGAKAEGGAIYAVGNATLENAAIYGNSVKSASDDESDVAHGGGIYSLGDLTLTDTSVYNNSATGDEAQGGGIYMDLSSGGAELNIISSNTESVVNIYGNTANGKADGIYFGNGSGSASLKIDVEGTVNLFDPVIVKMNSTDNFFFDSISSGGGLVGTLNWGGENSFSLSGGSAAVNLHSDKIYLTADYSLTVGDNDNLAISIGNDSVLWFDGSRGNDDALFFYGTGATTESFTVGTDAKVFVDLSSKLTSQDGLKYLVATNYDGSDSTFDGRKYEDENKNYQTELVLDDKGNIWLVTNYTSLYQKILDAADPNTQAGIDSGALDTVFEKLINEQRAQLTSRSEHFNNFTPGWIMNGLLSGRNTILAGADAARTFGLATGGTNGGYLGIRPTISGDAMANFVVNNDPAAYCGPRFWTGYIGDFERMDSHSDYYGYKASRHGILFGINYDAGTAGSIGLYGGYSKTTTKAKFVTGEIKSDTGHVGVIGSISPLRELTDLVLFADAGYTFSTNDSTRGAGSLRTDGEYDQKYYTAGLELNYTTRFGNSYLNPFASVRYMRIKQDAFTETGALASHLDSINESSTYTRAGVAVGTEMQTTFGSVTPSVSVAWRHNFDEANYGANTYFQAAPATSYRVHSAKMDKDSMDIGAAIRASLLGEDDNKQLGLNFGYNLNTSKNYTNHSVYIGLDLAF